MAMTMKSGSSRRGIVSEINVTPLVDVMLVLLIIFMVAAPMMVQGLDVKLPETSAKPIASDEKRLVVSIGEDHKIFIDDGEVDFDELGPKLFALQKERGGPSGVILRADKKIDYGFVVRVMGAIRNAGVEQIGMMTDPITGIGGDSNPKQQIPASDGVMSQ